MSRSSISVTIPGGQKRTVRLSVASAGQTIATVLEKEGLQLNMRCGGRGLCQGCTLVGEREGETETFRACQRKMGDLPDDITALSIPENSWRDHSLHGVSVFEIHTDKPIDSSRNSGYGLALDIGTTTLAGALWDYSHRRCLAHTSMPNPQARFGDNVVSRITFSMDRDDGARELQQALIRDGVKPLITALCQQAGIHPEGLVSGTASGNPTMLHTLAGESLAGFGKYPFKPVFLGQRVINSVDTGLDCSFPITLLPGLGPFVGADLVMGALASGMLEEEGPLLLIDFGTNGEILLKHDGGYLATATAAGPAFEGGRLACGAAARDGVISSIGRTDGQWTYLLSRDTEAEPTGISGAAYVDFMAVGATAGLLDSFGRFDRNREEVRERRDGEDVDWIIPISERTFISEADVAELLQAKAAIGGGVLTLMEQAGITAKDLKKVFVAGGFGYHLNPAHAIKVGLLPDIPMEQIRMIGNASLGGACLLLNDGASGLLRPLLAGCRVIELNQVDSFEDNYTDCLALDVLGA